MDFPYILRQSDVFFEGRMALLQRSDVERAMAIWHQRQQVGARHQGQEGIRCVSMCFLLFFKHLLNQLENQVYFWEIPLAWNKTFFFENVSGWDCRPSIQWHILKMCLMLESQLWPFMPRFLKTDSATSPTTLEPVGWPVARRELLGLQWGSHELLRCWRWGMVWRC